MVGLLRARRHSNIVLMSACGTKLLVVSVDVRFRGSLP
jgi:hypothetical protein